MLQQEKGIAAVRPLVVHGKQHQMAVEIVLRCGLTGQSRRPRERFVFLKQLPYLFSLFTISGAIEVREVSQEGFHLAPNGGFVQWVRSLNETSGPAGLGYVHRAIGDWANLAIQIGHS